MNHTKISIFLPDFNKIWIFFKNVHKSPQYQIERKSSHWETLMHEYRQTERYMRKDRRRDKLKYMAKLIGTFHDSVSKPRKENEIVKTGIHKSEYLILYATKDVE